MIKSYAFKYSMGLLLLINCLPVCLAADLITAYQQASQNDPTFKAAEAQWQATRQLLPMSRAVLLPSLSSSATSYRNHIEEKTGTRDSRFYQNAQTYELTLNQTIFDYRAFAALKNATAQVKSAYATYHAQAQDLMLRVATAYLAVLQAYDQWLATDAQKQALSKQLAQTNAQYEVGSIPITGVEQVRASYDAAIAQEITNKNTISDKLEELHAITGNFYTYLSTVKAELPLVSPHPKDINTWVQTAIHQNYTLSAANYAAQAAKANIGIQRAGHFPTVNAVGDYSYSKDSQSLYSGSVVPFTDKTASVGVEVKMPLFQGGLINAETRQAAAQYGQSSAQAQLIYLNTLTQTREAYLAVNANISKLKADRQAIISSSISLKATSEGYTMGNNTVIEVLQQRANLYTAQTNYATDQYNYLLNLLTLKQAAGTLNPNDLVEINTWLTRSINLSAYIL